MRFDELDLDERIMEGLEAMNFEEMTPVQEHTIPVMQKGRDLIGCAQTGTGKTAAYALPLFDKLLREGNPDNVVKSLIVVPTRELAQQIDVQFQGFAYFLPLSTTVVYGGGDGVGWSQQKQGMLMGADIVVATPGRLLAHITNSGIDLSHVGYFVLDEADRMLDMGFQDDIMRIIAQLPAQRQTIMFSATLPPKIRELARKIMHDPEEVSIAVSKPNEAIEQSAYVCYENQKTGIVRELFAEPKNTKTIVFASSKMKVKELAFTFKRMKLNAAAMHSDLEQERREEVMLDFRNGKIDILVATDIVARGIDIEDIGLVINYDVPRDPEDYIHRIGRTARASADGAAVTFVSEKEQGAFHRIETFIGREVAKLPLPEQVGPGPKYDPGRDDRRSGSRDRGRGRGRGRDRSPKKPSEPKAAAPADGTNDTAPTRKSSRNKRRRFRKPEKKAE
ncbi:DEAD/DEAH box helicase [uncultured Alistipes sp.]|uniref:DEAD/DEAH box helicase n=1 Tax=uncultured Alistipes sp. TaxID=538949 RepID=UPI0026023799|nr:DEAD/DEAH box helicase [uncultured Alistipes sp.]